MGIIKAEKKDIGHYLRAWRSSRYRCGWRRINCRATILAPTFEVGQWVGRQSKAVRRYGFLLPSELIAAVLFYALGPQSAGLNAEVGRTANNLWLVINRFWPGNPSRAKQKPGPFGRAPHIQWRCTRRTVPPWRTFLPTL